MHSGLKLKQVYSISRKAFGGVNNTNQISIFGSAHNNLRVISTPEFPVPYYQRIMRHPPSQEQVTVDLRKIQADIDDNIIIMTKEKLSKTSEGLKVLEFINNKVDLYSFRTEMSSIEVQAEIYADDLVNYIDSAHEENCKIIADVDLADCLRH